jgi:hypothetical protein
MWETLVQDMDGDNKPDIVARHYLGFSVFMNVNQGGDITEESFIRSTFNSENSLYTFSLVDFDGNGLKDVVGQYQNVMRIYPNLSVPGYIFFGSPVELPQATSFDDVKFSDYDKDGHIDIAFLKWVGDSNSSRITILRNENPKGSLIASNFPQRYTKDIDFAAIL